MIVDGANVGLFNQNFGEGGFNFYQVHIVKHEHAVVSFFVIVNEAKQKGWSVHFAAKLRGERDQGEIGFETGATGVVAS